MTTVSVCATACFLSASQPVSNAAATACPLSVARRSRSPGGAQPPLDVPPNGSRERGRGRRPCGLSATRCRVPRAPRGYAAVRDWRLTPQLWAPRAPRRHALALKAKLQRLARAERRAAASGPRASQATRRQPVSRFRSTQVRTVRQMGRSQVGRACRASSLRKDTSEIFRRNPSPTPVNPTPPKPQPSKRRRRTRRRAHLELLQRLMSKMSVRHATAAPWREAMVLRLVR